MTESMNVPEYELEWQRWRIRQKAAREKMLWEQAEDERIAREAAEAAANPAQKESEYISTQNLVIKNGVAQPLQPASPSRTTVKTAAFKAANEAVRHNRRNG